MDFPWSNRFVKALHPPEPDSRLYVDRPRLIRRFAEAESLPTRIFLEAQGGQGKTVLATQLLAILPEQKFWYPMDREDRDALVLMHTLCHALGEAFPFLADTPLYRLAARGEMVAADAIRYGQMLGEAVCRKGVFFTLMMDDLHLLAEAVAAKAFVTGLMETTGTAVRFFLASRLPIQPFLGCGPADLVFGNTDLALERGETVALADRIGHRTLSVSDIGRIHEETEGWVLGALTRLHGRTRTGDFSRGDASFLQREVMATLTRRELDLLCLLSFLEDIPEPLAVFLLDDVSIGHFLTRLCEKNYFIRKTGGAPLVFRMHHLFQDALQKEAKQRFSGEEIRNVLCRVSLWYRDQDRPDTAVRYALAAENYDLAEAHLDRFGLELVAWNRISGLQEVLLALPDAVFAGRGWLSLMMGMVLMDSRPKDVVGYLDIAVRQFGENRSMAGLLLARTVQVGWHAKGDCRFDLGLPALEEARRLYHQHKGDIPDALKARALAGIAGGCLYLEGDIPQAREYAEAALAAANLYGQGVNVLLEIRMLQCFFYGFSGDWRGFHRQIVHLNALAESQELNSYNRMLIWLTRINLLAMEGDFYNYHFFCSRLKRYLAEDLVAQGILAPFLGIWGTDIAIAENRLDEAGAIVAECLRMPHVGESPHMRSQFLHYNAYLSALQGETGRVLADIVTSRREREQAGSPYFRLLNHMVVGAAFACIGETEAAEIAFGNSLSLSVRMGETFVRAAVFSHRACLRLDTGNTQGAKQDLQSLAKVLDSFPYKHFFTLHPDSIRKLARAAVLYNIRPDLVKKHTEERLGCGFTADGREIPLLRIATLGRFFVATGKRVLLTADQLTASQQSLVMLLVAAPEGRIRVDEVQTILWPEKTPEKGRASFDTLLSRFRKVLSTALSSGEGGRASDYICLEKEVLCLRHVVLDIRTFLRFARDGLRHAARSRTWSAACCFRSAFRLWKGTFLPGFRLDHAAHQFKLYTLMPTYSEAARVWTGILAEQSEVFLEDVAVLELAVGADPGDLELVRNLYGIHRKGGNPVRADRILNRYREVLRKEGYSLDEISEFLSPVWE